MVKTKKETSRKKSLILMINDLTNQRLKSTSH
jgi:hypothetical protein